MLAIVHACILQGLTAVQIQVEVDVSSGLPDFILVGLPDATVRESRERVRSALKNSGFHFPARRILVNMAPAHVRKVGAGFDLAVAAGILKASGQLDDVCLDPFWLVGELSLDGSVKGIRGILPIALAMQSQKDLSLVLARENVREASRATERLIPVERLEALTQLGRVPVPDTNPNPRGSNEESPVHGTVDLSQIRGQLQARRALEVAAAGSHNLLMTGSPGVGKSLLAGAIASILPPMTEPEALEVNQIYSVAGLLSEKSPWLTRRPFRSPHHRISLGGMLGGGKDMRPGEITLATHGVLYLDEIPEFPRSILESLRQPMEEGRILMSRAWGNWEYPSRFQLVASSNPCHCGFYGDPRRECVCTEYQIQMYRNRISGPILDRIDLQVQVPRVELNELTDGGRQPESSHPVLERVMRARQRQARRARSLGTCPESAPETGLNAFLNQKTLDQACVMSGQARSFLGKAYDSLNLSARGYVRILRVARTIADLEDSDVIHLPHMAEALQYRGQEITP
ncbi:MAG: YifB family Mg chelatase-like AAA ATPase [Peptococcaceae bacterium]|jgi:magnesium chelatase family protein|nr:YifB family Mg chelatase-like AAA ATPase [Peptococcaceae bacterium]